MYWSEITILVPVSWMSSRDYEVADQQAFENAQVRVTSSAEDKPYVLNTAASCGCPGRFMRLSPRYVTDETLLQEKIGRKGDT